MSNTTTPLEMDYTNRDYDSIRTFLISAASGFMPEWVTVGESSDFGTLLLELYAYVGDILNYYIDRCAAEPFLATAQRRQSILGIADMLGYVPVAQQAAGGVLTFSLNDDTAHLNDTVLVPAGTVVQTLSSSLSSAIFFETSYNISLGGALDAVPSGRSVNVGANEGQTVDQEYLAISNGAPMQEYVLRYAGVIHRSLVLSIQETDDATVVWSYVDHLTDSNPDASVYTTYVDDQQFTHVVFGDNVAGRIPPVGAQVYVQYRYGQGANGNVAPGTIVQVTSPITGVTVNNPYSFSSGADNESIDSMRHSIPRAAKVKDRAITLQDFADLAHQVPGVAKATANGQFYTQIKVYIAPVGGGYPSPDLLGQVDSFLTSRSLVGTTVEMHPIDSTDPIYTYVNVEMVVHVLPQYGQLTVTNAVTAAILSVFAFDNMEFGMLISRGEVYHAALNVTGVDWIELTTLVPLDDSGNPMGTATVQDIQAGPTRIPISDADHITIDATGGLS